MTPPTLAKYLGLVTVAASLFLFLARVTYPPENAYSIMTETFSTLGSSDADNNPRGWYFLSIFFFLAAVLLVPVHLQRYNLMKSISKYGSLLSLGFYLVSSAGLVLLAVFPDNGGGSFFGDLSQGKIHNFVSLFAFGGFGVGMLLDFFWYLKDRLPTLGGTRRFPARLWAPPYAVFFAVVISFAYTQIYWDVTCTAHCWPGDGIYSFPLWEWIAIGMIFVVLFWIVLALTKIETPGKRP